MTSVFRLAHLRSEDIVKSISVSLFSFIALSVTLPVAAQPLDGSTGAQSAKTAQPSAVIGQPAPNFTLSGTDGSQTTLSDHRGTVVVLEWFNPDCPFVKLAHNQGKLGTRGAEFLKKGVKWIAINSGGEGRQGHGLERNRKAVTEYKLQWPIYLDPDGKVGAIYQAQRTPHIYVIDAKGILVYAGALDDSGGAGYEVAPQKDYLSLAIASAKSGTPLTTPKTKAWGCSVKYSPPSK